MACYYDSDLADLLDYNETEQHLALGNRPTVKLKTPLFLRQQQANADGVIFDVDAAGEQDIFYDEEDEDDRFDDKTLQSFKEAFNVSDDEDEGNVDEEKKELRETKKLLADLTFDTSYVGPTFAPLEKSMTKLDEKGLILKKVLRKGTRDVPDRSKVFYHYLAFAEGASEPYDTTLIRKVPQVIDMRQSGTVLPSLETCIRSMQLAELARFIIDPSVAFGELGCAPRIPPNAKLLFVVDVVQFIEESKLNTPFYMNADERQRLPFEKICEAFDSLIEEGNGQYNMQRFQYAVRKYRRAITMLDFYSVSSEEDEKKRSDRMFEGYINLAQAYLRMEKAPQACNACKAGLKLKDSKDKACSELLYRFAHAKLILNDAESANNLVDHALKLCSKNKKIKELKLKIEEQLKAQNEAHKQMCRRMFQGAPKPKNKFGPAK